MNMKMINRFFFISIESIESLESLEPQYRSGLESVDTEKSVSIDSSKPSQLLLVLIFLKTENILLTNQKVLQNGHNDFIKEIESQYCVELLCKKNPKYYF
jgi:hypothetical protein